jgi:hypothetical protein
MTSTALNIARGLPGLIGDTISGFLLGLANLAGWDWAIERTGHPLLHFDFERHDSHNWQAWGFGRSVVVSRMIHR